MAKQLNVRLSPYGIKGISHILQGNARRLSPALGLLMTTSPHVLANLRRVGVPGVTSPSIDLAKELFHQRSFSSENGLCEVSQRYGPLGTTKSRSRAAYWLTPPAIGTLVGLAISASVEKSVSDKVVDAALREVGIECNQVRGQWSGVSMARYRKIVNLLAGDIADNSSQTLPVMMAFLWEKSTSKQCLLDYIFAVERASGQSVLLPEFADLRIEGSLVRNEWLQTQFTEAELTAERVSTATAVLVGGADSAYSAYRAHTPSKPSKAVSKDAKESDHMTTAQALDIVAASYAVEKSFKPPIKLGRYAFQDGAPRPDCVEVVVREVVDSLIYDPATNRLRPERLPVTALPSVHQFYASLVAGEIDDVSSIPRAVTGGRQGGSSSSSSSSKGNDGRTGGADTQAGVTTKQYWEATTAGAAWFQLCSALPGLQYLSRAPRTGQEYELKPTMRNVCAALSTLVGLTPGQDASETGTVHIGDAISLKQIEEQWNAHIDLLGGNTTEEIKRIATTEGIVRFRAPFSDTEMINREVGKISFIGGRHALEIELESAHQLATVKHRLGASETASWSAALMSSLQGAYERQVESVLQGGEVSANLIENVTLSALLGDRKLQSLVSLLTKYKDQQSIRSVEQQRAVDKLVTDASTSARWGEERLSSSDIGDTGNGGVLSVTDASLTSAEAKLRQQAAVQATLQALDAITHCRDAAAVAHLTRWMLQEASSDVTVEQVADRLLRLPVQIRENAEFHHMLRTLGQKEHSPGLLMQKVLSFGTADCPFSSAGITGINTALEMLSVRDKARLCSMYAKFRLFS